MQAADNDLTAGAPEPETAIDRATVVDARKVPATGALRPGRRFDHFPRHKKENPGMAANRQLVFLRNILATGLLTLGLWSGSTASDLSSQLPSLGSSADSLLTPTRERKLGEAFMRHIRKTEKVLDDPALQDYIQTLGDRLVEHSDAQGEKYHFFLIDNPEINAFAGPGGYIGIYTGLVLTTESEGELAAVMAHEIAHVTQRHLLRSIESASRMSLPAAGLLLAAVALGVTVGGDAAMAAAVGGQASLLQQQINFTRSNEQEADRLGVNTLARAEFDPRTMPAFFSRMAQANQAYSSALPELLLTHPVSDSRMADTLARAETYPYRQNLDDLRYQLARIHLLQRREANPDNAVRDMRRQLSEGRYRNPLAARYGLAMALQRQKSWVEAADILDGLLAEHPMRIEFLIARTNIFNANNQFAAAARLLEGAVRAEPQNAALGLAYAEALLNAGDPMQADKTLQSLLKDDPDNPLVFALLSRTSGAMGRPVAGYDYLARQYYYDGQTDAAILQLEIALQHPSISYYDGSRLGARLADLKREKREQDSDRR